MILVDTSVWVDHLRRRDARLAGLLDLGHVLMHAFVLGEIACGRLSDRTALLDLLRQLPAAVAADDEETLDFIERHRLHGKSLGYIDVHLLASVALTQGARLWTRDKRLHAVADELALSAQEPASH